MIKISANKERDLRVMKLRMKCLMNNLFTILFQVFVLDLRKWRRTFVTGLSCVKCHM